MATVSRVEVACQWKVRGSQSPILVLRQWVRQTLGTVGGPFAGEDRLCPSCSSRRQIRLMLSWGARWVRLMATESISAWMVWMLG